jgi:antitoxin Phd
MENTWQIQEAKNKFSSLVEKAQHDGPQLVTKHGKKSVVVLSFEDYEKICKPQSDLLEFFRGSPLKGAPLKIERDKSMQRDIDL